MAATNLPSSASTMYKTLHSTAIEFIRSQDQDVSTPTCMNNDRIRAIRAESGFQHSWGHNYLVSTKPGLSSVLDVDGFIAHLSTMLPHLESWDTEITDIMIDELRLMAMVRGSYYMRAKGAEVVVENDLIWFLTMSEDGKKVAKSVEFIDVAASQKLKEIIKGVKK
ncbi:uncharacterized protein BDR25DRAFT_278606 [Lindgomyces ingoldianus]|uniref:Uncharacterized protein n=1 Tax=Lindgomyces ingoldianus TaxID=673940 RepID=A0ACB6R9W0_9PLEO|nr:uncharacterized protein BDR25DRAFT_278606 [Lindgomyces ingoldianus]KAF2475877.1 hypothetical protein BDR25DRAFT_278606 [Lindgomyces ingoldianus]